MHNITVYHVLSYFWAFTMFKLLVQQLWLLDGTKVQKHTEYKCWYGVQMSLICGVPEIRG